MASRLSVNWQICTIADPQVVASGVNLGQEPLLLFSVGPTPAPAATCLDGSLHHVISSALALSSHPANNLTASAPGPPFCSRSGLIIRPQHQGSLFTFCWSQPLRSPASLSPQHSLSTLSLCPLSFSTFLFSSWLLRPYLLGPLQPYFLSFCPPLLSTCLLFSQFTVLFHISIPCFVCFWLIFSSCYFLDSFRFTKKLSR